MSTDDVIFLDHHATTPCDPRVVEAMLPYFTEVFGNPSSESHAPGRMAKAAVERAREQVAQLIGGAPAGVTFTSGATEALSWALQSLAALGADDGRDEIVLATTEHKAVIDTCRFLEARRGVTLRWLPVDRPGISDPAELAELLSERTACVAVMAANNETGVLQPIDEIARICAEQGVPYLCDATQAVGKVAFDASAMGITLVAASAHKIYGPKGAGCLWVGDRKLRRQLRPLIVGGGQERGRRSGTLNVPAIVGFGAAASIAASEWEADGERLRGLRNELLARLQGELSDVEVNGCMERRLPHNLNVSIAGVDSQALMAAVPTAALSAGSACTAATVEPSHVLTAMGLGDLRAHEALRFGLGRATSRTSLGAALDVIVTAVSRIRTLSP